MQTRALYKAIPFILCCFLLFTNCKRGNLSSSPGERTQSSKQEEQVPFNQDPNNKSHQFSITQLAYENTKVDIVIVMDSSPSMEDDFIALSHHFDSLFNQTLASIDWQMAFLASDGLVAQRFK